MWLDPAEAAVLCLIGIVVLVWLLWGRELP